MSDEKKPLDPSTTASLINAGTPPPAEEAAAPPALSVVEGDGVPMDEVQAQQKKVDKLVDTMTPRQKQWAGHYQAQVLQLGERLIKRELPMMLAKKEVTQREASDPSTLMLLGANLADNFMVAVNDDIIKRFGADTTMAEMVCICAHMIGRQMGINAAKGNEMPEHQKGELYELFQAGVILSAAYTKVMMEQPQGGAIQRP